MLMLGYAFHFALTDLKLSHAAYHKFNVSDSVNTKRHVKATRKKSVQINCRIPLHDAI